ncbi:hypothetical protein E2C01_011009 [Portunus trituberculatus]|uniref:Uncharacterized protein n=1 Tax=Portunus trituberculatus TaxID=210409 RepID=A0A5B7DAD9_PORTR|nr:hypothetical protein [Portunus trituberculatus]
MEKTSEFRSFNDANSLTRQPYGTSSELIISDLRIGLRPGTHHTPGQQGCVTASNAPKVQYVVVMCSGYMRCSWFAFCKKVLMRLSLESLIGICGAAQVQCRKSPIRTYRSSWP